MAHPDVGDDIAVGFFDEVECDALALAEESEHAAVERSGAQYDLVEVGVNDDDTGLCSGVVCLYEALHAGRLGLFDLAGFEAGGAHTDALGVGPMPHADPLNVGGPAAI